MFDRLITDFARQTPNALAAVSVDGFVTYRDFDATIDRCAAALAEANPPRSGLAGIAVSDRYTHWVILIALARLGITTTSYLSVMRDMMEPLLKPDFVITDDPDNADEARRPRILRIPKDWLAIVAKRPHVRMPRPKIDPDGLSRISTSSGTTNVPKKFGISWKSVESRIMEGAVAGAITGAMARPMALMGPEFLPYPGTIITWCVGGTVAFGGDDPFTAAKSLNYLKPTNLLLAPIQLKALLDALPPDFSPIPGLWLTLSGAHTPRAVRDEARLRLASNLAVIYGTTEAGMIAIHRDTEKLDDADVGWISSWANVEIVDDAHHPVGPDTLGRIRLRGTNVIERYLDDDEANAKFFRDGWFYPGDVGRLTPEGRLRVEGRTDEMMNFGGASFMPHVIEGAVMACAGVADAAAFAMPDKNGFDAPWIAIVRREGLKEQDIAKALMLPGLPPAHVVWVDEIPRTATGKAHRDQLQAGARALKSS